MSGTIAPLDARGHPCSQCGEAGGFYGDNHDGTGTLCYKCFEEHYQPGVPDETTTSASDVVSRRLRWAWRPWHAVGYLTVLTGTRRLARACSRHGCWPGTPAASLTATGGDGR